MPFQNSTLRQDWIFFLISRQVSPNTQSVDLRIGRFTDEELVETVTARLIDVGFDFATIVASSLGSYILFAIVLVQLIKLKFLPQQRELKKADVKK